MNKSKLFFIVGLILVVGYLFQVAPESFHPGYAGDQCFSEVTRFELHHQIKTTGSLTFTTQNLRYPFGSSLAFMPWGIEKDVLGAIFLEYFPQAKFLFLYVLFSFLISYVTSGLLIRSLIGGSYYWLVSAFFVLFNIPRHFKFWLHYEFLSMHWLHIGILLDALIWKRFLEEKTWSLRLEIWRGLAMMGMLGTALYFWGPLTITFLIVRLSMLFWWYLHRKSTFIRLEWPQLNKLLLFEVSAALFYSLVILAWYIPLLKQVNAHGPIPQGIDYKAHWGQIFRPLWLDSLVELINLKPNWTAIVQAFDQPETVVTIGWTLLMPLFFVIKGLKQSKRLSLISPFLIILMIGILYISSRGGHHFQDAVRAMAPFMSFFRVASRWGLILPTLVSVAILLGWPQFIESIKTALKFNKPSFVFLFFGAIFALETRELFSPPNIVPPLSADAIRFFDTIKNSSGEAVMDLPFGVIGGNAACKEASPFYDATLLSQCLLPVHGKKVFSLYQARLTNNYCSNYFAEPYSSWMKAWKENRCFNDNEMKLLCEFTKAHASIDTILIYQGIWTATQNPSCLDKFNNYFGKPLDQTSIPIGVAHSNAHMRKITLLKFSGKCL